MQLSDIFLRLGEETFTNLLRTVSLGKLKTYQLFDRLKTRLYLNKLNSETLRKSAPRSWARLGEHDDEFATELSQAILVSHLDMIQAVLNHLGVPHQDGFFDKDANVQEHPEGRLAGRHVESIPRKIRTCGAAVLHQPSGVGSLEIRGRLPGPRGMSLFFDAIKAGDTSQVTALLDADPSLANAEENGQPAIFTAKYQRKQEIAELLATRGATMDVFTAAMMGRTETLEELLTGNRSLASLISRDGWTALHLAAFFDAESTARILLNKGAKVNARSTNALANMPLHAAAAGRSIAVVKLLLDHGADAGAQQHSGWTPLHAAAQNGDVPMATMLVTAGADVNARADNQQRPLDLALTKSHQEMVEYLESKGARL